jgi:radical SAM protein with 4Fe4S-binding SPASM domain
MQKNKLKSFFTIAYYKLNNLLKRKTFDFPIAIEIETITACNRRCLYCPNSKFERGLIKNKKFMDIKLFNKIIDDLAQVNYDGRISPHFYGEPLLDERLLSIIKYTKEKLPNSQIVIFSNGDLLTINKYEELKKAGIHKFIITQHSPEMSENMEKLFEYQKNEKNPIKIEYLTNLNQGALDNRGGLVNPKKVNKRKRCHLPFSVMVVDYKGNVILCCNDYHSSIKFGDLKKEKLFDIWNKPFYKKIRYDLLKGNFELDICKKCIS